MFAVRVVFTIRSCYRAPRLADSLVAISPAQNFLSRHVSTSRSCEAQIRRVCPHRSGDIDWPGNREGSRGAGGIGNVHRQHGIVVSQAHVKNIAAVQIYSAESSRRYSRRDAIDIYASGVGPFTSVIVEIKFYRHALWNARSATRGAGAVTQTAARRTYCGRRRALDCQGKAVGGRRIQWKLKSLVKLCTFTGVFQYALATSNVAAVFVSCSRVPLIVVCPLNCIPVWVKPEPKLTAIVPFWIAIVEVAVALAEKFGATAIALTVVVVFTWNVPVY